MADSDCEYATLTVPAGKDAVVIVRSEELIVIDSALVDDCELLSATPTVKFDVPAVVGVPLITPPEEINRPAGKDPPASDHV